MSLFQKSVENKYLNDLDSILIDEKYADFQNYFGNPERQENIRNSKEEQFQEGFLRELFVKILGYTLNPEPNFNLISEQKNISDSKKADGAILKGEDATAVIELKGTDTTDLDKIETQAFGYKNHHPKCNYVITSNFEKLRFYIQNAVDHIDFNLFKLSKEQFSLLWLCLAKDNLLNDLPLKIKESSVLQEENITKKLYADYSKFREAIYNNLVKNNPETDKLLLFKKTQKLLDRFLFIFFAEDRLLLPPNSITEIVKQWTALKDEYDEYSPLYSRFKKYFGYMNTGFKGKKYQIYAYNGGLFKPDEILDNITIDDDILHEHTLCLSKYDFETDVDVNILGHIFEHSLGEIENVQAEIKGEKVQSQKTKRKKDGIFYTPKYITKYIVENTLGKLCEEKRSELKIIDEKYAKGRKNRKKEVLKSLDKKLDVYRNYLLSLSIIDPACGSGAFLNQALEFLINEHRKIDELRRQLLGNSILFSDITSDILEKNIYGVDLNEESVEIAKLSLWLRTAQKGRKLNTLSNNIKCGNSLIDDPEVAGDKAFNWQNEFPEIFAKGGFDVVIGNPPYGASISKSHQEYYLNSYETPSYKLDTYSIFIEKGIKLLNKNEVLGFIVPYTWMTINQHFKLRKYLFNYEIYEIVNLPQKIFEDADLDTVILNLRKSNPKNFISIGNSKNGEIITTGQITIDGILKNTDLLINTNLTVEDSKIVEKLRIKSSLDTQFEVSQGYIPYRRSDLIKEFGEELGNKIVDERLWHSASKTSNEWKQEIQGRDLSRFFNTESFQYVKYGKHLAGFVAEKFFQNPRILIMEVTRGNRYKISATFVEKEYYNTPSIINIIQSENNIQQLRYLLGVLNSSLITWYHTKVHPKANAVTSIPKILIKDIRKLPIPDLSIVNHDIIQFVEYALECRIKLNSVLLSLCSLFQTRFEIEKLPSKLNNWHEIEFKIFLKELKKAKIELSLSEEAEWMQYFNEQKEKAQTLKSEIEKTDKEIDQMVYELYGLTKDEIKIIENS